MSKPLKTYDLASIFILLGGRRLGGFGEEGVIEFEFGSDIGEPTKSADGDVTFSRSNDHSMIATITLMETSKSYRDLAEMMHTQQAQEVIESLAFLMSDEINGDKITDNYATFLTRPAPNKGKKVGERQFKLLLPNGAKDAKYGADIAI